MKNQVRINASKYLILILGMSLLSGCIKFFPGKPRAPNHGKMAPVSQGHSIDKYKSFVVFSHSSPPTVCGFECSYRAVKGQERS